MPILTEKGPTGRQEQRAALEQGLCSHPACRRPFLPRRSGGKAQRFCSAECRRLFDAEVRRIARAVASRRVVTASVRARSRRGWSSGIDTATGRRVPIAVRDLGLTDRAVVSA